MSPEPAAISSLVRALMESACSLPDFNSSLNNAAGKIGEAAVIVGAVVRVQPIELGRQAPTTEVDETCNDNAEKHNRYEKGGRATGLRKNSANRDCWG